MIPLLRAVARIASAPISCTLRSYAARKSAVIRQPESPRSALQRPSSSASMPTRMDFRSAYASLRYCAPRSSYLAILRCTKKECASLLRYISLSTLPKNLPRSDLSTLMGGLLRRPSRRATCPSLRTIEYSSDECRNCDSPGSPHRPASPLAQASARVDPLCRTPTQKARHL